ncbi:hypothetical protein H4R23_005493, partial [Coemansia sp. Cherry 401B]
MDTASGMYRHHTQSAAPSGGLYPMSTGDGMAGAAPSICSNGDAPYGGVPSQQMMPLEASAGYGGECPGLMPMSSLSPAYSPFSAPTTAAAAPAYSPNGVSSFDMSFGYPTQARDSIGSVLLDTHATLGMLGSPSQFDGMHAYNSSMATGAVLSTPMSAGASFPASHFDVSMTPATCPGTAATSPDVAAVAAAAALAAAVSSAAPTSAMGMPLMALASPQPPQLPSANSAPADMIEFSHDAFRTASSAMMAAASPAMGSGKGAVRRARQHNGTTEHRYRRKSVLDASDLLGTANGAAGSSAGSSAAHGALRSVSSSTLPEAAHQAYRYEHVFPVHEAANHEQRVFDMSAPAVAMGEAGGSSSFRAAGSSGFKASGGLGLGG